MRITVACPETMRNDANNFAMVMAFGPADALTYGALNWRDGDGNLYAAASFPAPSEWVLDAQGPLSRPAWDADQIIDMDAAERAQAALVFWTPDSETPPATGQHNLPDGHRRHGRTGGVGGYGADAG